MPKTFPFPHGATGIEVGDFVLQVAAGKIVALAKDRGEHYTLHFGEASGVLDLHRTWKDEGGIIRHKTVFAMLHADIPAVLNELAPTVPNIFRLHRKLRVGWMHRHGIGIVRGLEPLTDADIEAVTRKRPGRKRIVVDEEKVKANLFIPEYLDDVWDMTDGAFSLLRGSKRIGIFGANENLTRPARIELTPLETLLGTGDNAKAHPHPRRQARGSHRVAGGGNIIHAEGVPRYRLSLAAQAG
jgi:hypothetical protein